MINLFIVLNSLVLIIILTELNNENVKRNFEQECRNEELSKLMEYTNMLEYVSKDYESLNMIINILNYSLYSFNKQIEYI
ncbi:hypothetical protein KPL35_14780 [Clostridium sp. CF011]|uniref:hypothetical protein n=1 Tax=unclassified Clostridium TaxID=2614128 RepID=UPI001C0D0A44|nr:MULTISPECIES: hypothetical protein [unclassified Clostridium]MBU3093332.1 hypothetical protein [Clostridium sp. CF011]UVE41788.1 hypothetical protein KTC92_04780 [Clostridium sp. CM027]WAG70788.1 hypothetical protein LL036_04985 [Clostridium sp. CF011]